MFFILCIIIWNMIDSQDLKAFTTIAELGSFSKAAILLHRTQPAISKRIAHLEESLNCKLFDRIGREVRLTEAGRVLLHSAHGLVHQLEELPDLMHGMLSELQGTLTIGTSHHIGLHYLPELLKSFSDLYPRIHLDVHFLDSEEVHQKVRSGLLDMGLATLPPYQDNTLELHNLWKETLCIAVPLNHDLAKKDEVDLTELTTYPALLPGPNTFTHQIIEQLFHDRKLHIRMALSTNYLHTLTSMVEAGLGWSILPVGLTGNKTRALRISGYDLQRNLGLVLHPRRSPSRANRLFLQLLKITTIVPA